MIELSMILTGIMDNNTNSSPEARLIPVLLFFGGLLCLYYLYMYLFGPKTTNEFPLITATQTANVDASKVITITSDKLPVLYEGGDFTISTWVYINNWSYRQGYNKSILRIGGSNFDTIRIHLGGYKPKLFVRFHTMDKTASTTNDNSGDSNTSESLEFATLNSTYDVQSIDSGLLESSVGCDLPDIDLQRWVNITVAVSGKTVDVYMDGKLSRSCVLPTRFKVDTSYSAYLLYKTGFGGQISTTTMYDSALNPEMVYKNYMAGPEPITGLWQWFSSFFAPGVDITVSSK